MVLARLEDVGAEEQELLVDLIEDDPLNRLGTILRISVLLVRADGSAGSVATRASARWAASLYLPRDRKIS